jgi:hypothetical protein
MAADRTVAANPPGAAPAASPAVSDGAPAADANLSNLTETQLKALLQDIDNLPAVPVADPEPVSLRIGARTSGVL